MRSLEWAVVLLLFLVPHISAKQIDVLTETITETVTSYRRTKTVTETDPLKHTSFVAIACAKQTYPVLTVTHTLANGEICDPITKTVTIGGDGRLAPVLAAKETDEGVLERVNLR